MDAHRCLRLVFCLRVYKNYKTTCTNFLKSVQLQHSPPLLLFRTRTRFSILVLHIPVSWAKSLPVILSGCQSEGLKDSKRSKGMWDISQPWRLLVYFTESLIQSLEHKWEIKLPSSFLILDSIVLFPLADCSAFSVSLFCRMKQLQQEKSICSPVKKQKSGMDTRRAAELGLLFPFHAPENWEGVNEGPWKYRVDLGNYTGRRICQVSPSKHNDRLSCLFLQYRGSQMQMNIYIFKLHFLQERIHKQKSLTETYIKHMLILSF